MSSEQETDSDLVAQLLRAAGRREEPPADAYRQTLDAATKAWRDKVRNRTRGRFIAFAAAASLLVTLAGALLAYRILHPVLAGEIERLVGSVQMQNAPRDAWMPANQSAPLYEGTRLRTGRAGLAGVVLDGGASLRLAQDTEIVFNGGSRLTLVAGRAYLDNDAASRIEIATPVGVATDVGTQFEVLYVDATYRVRVREGRVHIQHEAGDIETAAGDEVSIDAGGRVRRSRIARDHEDWRWVEGLSPTPDLEGQPVSALLAWIARETGRAVKFEPPEMEQKARRTILHGDVRSLAPLEALEVMLQTTDLTHSMLEDGTIVIRPRIAG